MAPVTPSSTTPTPGSVRRRVPTQMRSRERVEKILDVASHIVVSGGVEALTTRSIAEAAEIPVASVYQYFADRDAILLALVERDTEEMDEQVRTDLGALTTLSIASLVETTMRAYTAVYARRPDFLEIWVRGRSNSAVNDFGRQHNRRTAAELREFAIAAGLAKPETPLAATELAVEIGDRVFQLAYETDSEGDEFLINQGIAMVTAYLLNYATPAGIEGVSA
ncbi:TetR/AcrR family transcriptional regulator [Nocardioides marmorisolisilvae]|uniref:TetR/AcrR family transcriptional regulator n=1 Tax=Nocardioides marmorisolisilvae TaxID=1542737 RepID=A0A3N0DRK7_9ACTN|nr:TetR/AcrR family transcriptional regulator [Nocardioides marmorisolisilvae]RNL78268.1 TetR/AcrR family transcriptional regulator [Nocardioides marmorisolisilvae]